MTHSSAPARPAHARGGEPLPADIRGLFEPSVGHSLEDIRIFADAESDRTAHALHANAFTFGRDVHFAKEHYDPHSAHGLHTLAHEVAHTVQQREIGEDVLPDRLTSVGESMENEARSAATAMLEGAPVSLAPSSMPAVALEPEGEELEWLPGWVMTKNGLQPKGKTSTATEEPVEWFPGWVMTETGLQPKTTSKTTASGSWNDEKAEIKRTTTDDSDEANKKERSTAVGYEKGQGYVEHESGTETKDVLGTKQTSSTSTKFSGGKDGAGMEWGKKSGTEWSETDKESTATSGELKVSDKEIEGGGKWAKTTTKGDTETGTNASGSLSMGEEGYGGKFKVGGTTKVDDPNNIKSGPKETSWSAGGGAKVDESGALKELEAEGSVGKGPLKGSAKGKYEVTAGEPRQVDGKWYVDWKRTTSGGVKGEAKGVGLSGEASDEDNGTRVFASEAEAKSFKAHVARDAPSALENPNTIAGALKLQVGESRGHTTSTGGGISGEVNTSGGGSMGAGYEQGSSTGTKVLRRSENEFDLTIESGSHSGTSMHGSTPVYGAKTSDSSKEKEYTTVRVNISTAEGKAAFETYLKTGFVIPGARVVRQNELKSDATDTTASILGHTNQRLGTFEEEHDFREDDKGKKHTTDRFTGETHERDRGGWFDTAKSDVDAKFEARREDDKLTNYSLTGTVEADSVEASRHGLYELTGMADRGEARPSDAKSSGKWSVEAEMTPELVEAFMDTVSDEKVRELGIFEGSDPRNALRQALKEAKTPDEKSRAMARFFKSGFEGKAIKAMRDELFPVVNQWKMAGSYEDILSNQKGNFNYDLSLPGDRNFRGSGPRHELEGKLDAWEKQAQATPNEVGKLHHEIYAALTEVRRQRAEIADPKRYQDLPTQLRDTQVARLDGYVTRLSSLAGQAGSALTQQDAPAEPAPDAKGGAHGGKNGKPATSAADGSFQKLRSDIGAADKGIQDRRGRYQETADSFKLIFAASHRGRGDIAPDKAKAIVASSRLDVEAKGYVDQARAMEPSVNDLRSQFIEALNTPDTATAIGAGLLGQLTILRQSWTSAAQKMDDAQNRLIDFVDLSSV